MLPLSGESLKQSEDAHRLIYTVAEWRYLLELRYGDDSSAEPYLIIWISLQAHWGRKDESANAQGEIPAYYISY